MTDQQSEHGTISELEATYPTIAAFEATFRTIDQAETAGELPNEETDIP